jgi:hypothetical protein
LGASYFLPENLTPPPPPATDENYRQKFHKIVEAYLNDGWTLAGGIAVDKNNKLLQAMHRDIEY